LRHTLVRRFAYTPEQLFALVGDVERYPEFVPWITGLRAWNRKETGEGVTTLDAEAKVRFHIVRERFVTRVRLDAHAMAIDVSLISGPFRRLRNRWRFQPRLIDGRAVGCELVFEIDFEFGSRLLHGLMAANLDRAVARLVGCFERRAEALYGPAALPQPIAQ
jgi:coenzyme Q-binding protein COQ10